MGDILRHRDIDEDFLERFVSDVAKHRPEFVAADATERIRLQRKLYRRLRYPAYDAGTKTQSAGRVEHQPDVHAEFAPCLSGVPIGAGHRAHAAACAGEPRTQGDR